MELKIQSWGNSAAVRLNQGLLKQIKSKVGETLSVEVIDGGLLLKPTEPVYSLDELLSTCTKDNMRLEEEDRLWVNDAPVGKEI